MEKLEEHNTTLTTPKNQHTHQTKEFSGNIYIFQAFDVGDDIDIEKIEELQTLRTQPLTLPKYFKRHHEPLAVELPHPHETSAYFSSKLDDFGVISITYKVPFTDTLEGLREQLNDIDSKYQEQSVNDAHTIFKKIERHISKPKFFHLRTSYVLIQLNVDQHVNARDLNEQYSNTIASLVRFETETLSDYQRTYILNNAVSYYQGKLVVIDGEASFIYDDDYEDLLGLFEFSNIQHLELQYFDQLLAEKLNALYERKTKFLLKRQIIPFMSLPDNPVADLGRLKVDISVITEKLQSSIMLANEPYLTEIYERLAHNLDLNRWKKSIDNKLDIIKGVNSVYYSRIETIRGEMLEVLIIILILIEVVIAIIKFR
jgi:hypothetical protein